MSVFSQSPKKLLSTANETFSLNFTKSNKIFVSLEMLRDSDKFSLVKKSKKSKNSRETPQNDLNCLSPNFKNGITGILKSSEISVLVEDVVLFIEFVCVLTLVVDTEVTFVPFSVPEMKSQSNENPLS